MNHFQSNLTNETHQSDAYYVLQTGETGFMILDARSPEAFAQGHVPGAISMPHRKLSVSIIARSHSTLVQQSVDRVGLTDGNVERRFHLGCRSDAHDLLFETLSIQRRTAWDEDPRTV